MLAGCNGLELVFDFLLMCWFTGPSVVMSRQLFDKKNAYVVLHLFCGNVGPLVVMSRQLLYKKKARVVLHLLCSNAQEICLWFL